MPLNVLSVAVVLITVYAFWREGVLTAFTMMCNVVLAGLVAFNFWEPIARELGSVFADTFLAGLEDCLCLTLLFALTLGMLRLTTNTLAMSQPEYHPVLQQGGAVLCGLITGYLVSGFLVCAIQTLPLPERFMSFDAKVQTDASGQKPKSRWMPADRVWLALMQRASLVPLSQADGEPFDKDGDFELRYQQNRRYPDTP
jgi:hypothetical protein